MEIIIEGKITEASFLKAFRGAKAIIARHGHGNRFTSARVHFNVQNSSAKPVAISNKENEQGIAFVFDFSGKDEAQKEFERLNSITERLVKEQPEAFVKILNSVIKIAWGKIKPMVDHGPNAGQPLAQPYFSVDGGRLFLHSETRRDRVRAFNPIYQNKRLGEFWRNAAWKWVTAQYVIVLSRYAESEKM